MFYTYFYSSLKFMDNYFICRVAVAPLRASNSDKSEIVSQLLFGDKVAVLEKAEQWWRISNKADEYEGWLDFKQLQPINEAIFNDESGQNFIAPANFENKLQASDGTIYYLSAGTTLPYYNNGFCYLGDEKFSVRFEPIAITTTNFEQIETFAKFFENAPYLWGGKNVFGIDCSGFTQVVFKMLGIWLKRDASRQATQGETILSLNETKTGDLAFFDNEAGKITHVGIMLGNAQIIHASGRVRIDKIDNQGIYNEELKKYTHKLKLVKRLKS
jgi:cell wall-associated NlpC family hydrolase